MASLERDAMIDGRYRVLKRLGSGGMADVYCAHDDQLGRLVALKVLYRRLAEDVQFVERFRREASSAAGLQHPNVVAIFDRGEWNGTYYIAMEYVEGRTLKDIVRERGPAPPEAAVDVILQVLRAARDRGAQAGFRDADPAARDRPDDPARARGRRAAGDGEGPGAPVRERRR